MIRYKLKFWRIEQGFTQAQVAEKLGTARGYFKDVENGKYKPSDKFIAGFAKAYNMDIAVAKELFTEGAR